MYFYGEIKGNTLLVSEAQYESVREGSVHGRYLNLVMITPVLNRMAGRFSIKTLGSSVQNEPIYQACLGSGQNRVLMWSQMHGNESTTTKAVIDLLGFLSSSGHPVAKEILGSCTIVVLPMLNPDGARAYTRVNANQTDLNRDAQALKQPESQILRTVFESFKPEYCFNLHDQRTLFNVGETPKPATMSFLAPAFDEARSISGNRLSSMKLIAHINEELQTLIPGQVGRYDDSFNLQCVGDTFQSLGAATLLFEAGHFPGDYEREKSRGLVFMSLVEALHSIATKSYEEKTEGDYHRIPENQKRLLDIIIKNPHCMNPQWEGDIRIGIQFREELRENRIYFVPQIQEVGLLKDKFGHVQYDCESDEERGKIRRQPELFRLLN